MVADRLLVLLGNAEEHADGAHGDFGAEVGDEVEAALADERIERAGRVVPHLGLNGRHAPRGEDAAHDAAVEVVVGRVLEDEHARRHLHLRLDDLEHRALGRAVGLPLDRGALHVVVAADGVELVLLVEVERAPRRAAASRPGRGRRRFRSRRGRSRARARWWPCRLPPSRSVASRRTPPSCGVAVRKYHYCMERGPFSKAAVPAPGRPVSRPRRSEPSRPWPSIPAMVGRRGRQFGDLVAVRDGATTLTYAELAEAARELRCGAGRGRGRARRPGGHLVRQLRRMDGGRPRPVRRRCGPRARQHPLQGSRGRRPPRTQRGPRPRHRDRLPGHRLRRHARGRRHPAARRCETIVVARGDAPADGGVVGRLHGAGHPGRPSRGRAPERSARAGRPVRHPLHLGHDRRAQGRRHDARPHAHRRHGLGGHDRAAAPATSICR